MSLAGTAVLSDAVMAQSRKRQSAALGPVWTGRERMKSAEAPVSVKSSTLVVNDLNGMSRFYQATLGLDLLHSDGEEHALGAGGQPLLILQKDIHARRYPREAGLFHNAFLMPDRAALGRWLRHAVETGVRFTGAADHDVSEALYLDDPEGNGIEVYADHPTDQWDMLDNGLLALTTTQLDADGVLQAADETWGGAPEDLVIGHVHLQVGDIEDLHQFMTQSLGQDLMAHEGSAAFYATGGYHHHFAGNIWNSRAAALRSPDSTGLAGITLRSDGTIPAGEATDPWGTRFTIEEV